MQSKRVVFESDEDVEDEDSPAWAPTAAPPAPAADDAAAQATTAGCRRPYPSAPYGKCHLCPLLLSEMLTRILLQ